MQSSMFIGLEVHKATLRNMTKPRKETVWGKGYVVREPRSSEGTSVLVAG